MKLVVSDAHEGLKQAIARVLGATWQRCRVHTIRTQLRGAPALTFAAGLRGTQRDDMAYLQAAVADDDALDDELQDRLLVGERRLAQAPVNAGAECFQAGADCRFRSDPARVSETKPATVPE